MRKHEAGGRGKNGGASIFILPRGLASGALPRDKAMIQLDRCRCRLLNDQLPVIMGIEDKLNCWTRLPQTSMAPAVYSDTEGDAVLVLIGMFSCGFVSQMRS